MSTSPLPQFPLLLTVAAATLTPPEAGSALPTGSQPLLWLALCAAVSEQTGRVHAAGQGLWGTGCALGCVLALAALVSALGAKRERVRLHRRSALLSRVCFGGALVACLVGGSIAVSSRKNPAVRSRRLLSGPLSLRERAPCRPQCALADLSSCAHPAAVALVCSWARALASSCWAG